MKLEDFHRMVSFELRKGNSLDAYIPLWTKQAVSLLERNAPLKYMEELVQLWLKPGDQVVDFVWAFRNWKYLRYPAQGEWVYINKQDPRNEQFPPGGAYSLNRVVVYPQNEPMLTPAWMQPGRSITSFYQIGMRYIRFDAPWSGIENIQLDGLVYKFSDWQTTKTDYRHFLLDHGSDLLLYQTMLRIGAAVKDERLQKFYAPLRQEALQTFMSMDQDAEYGEAQQDFMEYGGVYR